MRIDHLELINFKNFSQLSIDFKPGVNLLVGINGSGKTAILEGLTVALGGFFPTRLPQQQQRAIKPNEVKVTNGEREEKTTVVASNNSIGTWTRNFNAQTGSNDNKGLGAIKRYADAVFKSFSNVDELIPAPIMVLYSTQRLFGDANKTMNNTYDPHAGRRNGYIRPLHETSLQSLLNDWLSNAIVDRATHLAENVDEPNLALENIQDALCRLIRDFLALPIDSIIKIYPKKEFKNELMLAYDGQPPLPLSYYSDGFRAIIYLLIDLVWRASQLNPWMKLSEMSNRVTGVILIDEIDLHLHPNWQGKVIPFLQTLFPEVQFFITTHSATVVANFKDGTLYRLRPDGITQVQDKYFGREVAAVLRDILGAKDRNPAVQHVIDELLRTIDVDNTFEKANVLLTRLLQLIGPDDSELQRAAALIEWERYQKEQGDNAIHS